VSGDIEALVRRLYAAWPAKDRATVESLVDDDFHFTSPLDNRLDRASFFARCWPNSASMKSLELMRITVDGNLVLVTYEAETHDGKRFRNTEALRIATGKVQEVEVYFGWNLPHPAPLGGFVEQ
jgi:ketosteroid isomerase-like protein